MTLADLAFAATYATMKSCGHVDLSPFVELNAWFDKVSKEIPNFNAANTEGADAFGKWYKSKAKL